MAPAVPLRQAGQASIEFILLLVMVLLLLHTLILPHALVSERVMQDTQTLSRASGEGQKLAQAINDVNAGAIGTRQTVRLLVSEDFFFSCVNKDNWEPFPETGEWGDQAVLFDTVLDYTEDSPLSLPLMTLPSSDPNYDALMYQTMVRNRGGCQVYPAGMPHDFCGYSVTPLQPTMRCIGVIPVAADCSIINEDGLLNPINFRGSGMCKADYDRQNPITNFYNVQVEKTATGVSIKLVS